MSQCNDEKGWWYQARALALKSQVNPMPLRPDGGHPYSVPTILSANGTYLVSLKNHNKIDMDHQFLQKNSTESEDVQLSNEHTISLFTNGKVAKKIIPSLHQKYSTKTMKGKS